MKQKNLYGGILIIVVLLGAAIIAVTAKGTKDSTNNMTSPSPQMKMTPQPTTKSTAPSDATATDKVTIENFAFGPKAIKVKVGTTVTWTNQDAVGHTVTADTKAADAPSSPIFNKGETYSFTFKKAGTYDYHCEPHPYMKATVVVTE